MKNNKKILAVLMVSAITSLSAQAQIQPATTGVTVPMNTPVVVGEGNVYEKEVTPLLRDISKKKSLLELRKLDRELEKLEEETLTAQLERDKALNPPAPVPPVGFPQGLPQVIAAPVVEEEDPIRVLMVYGFDNNLYAKVASGAQGGYIVKKGDILPDGRLVLNINPNFLEVKKAKKTKGGSTQKLYVSGPSSVKSGSSSSSSSSVPSVSPVGLPVTPVAPTTFLPTVGSVTPLIGTGAVPLNTPVRR